MTETLWSDVDDWFTGHFLGTDEALDHVLEASTSAGLPAIAVSALQGKFLHLLARIMRAERILEIGTLGGYSTIWLARALQAGGKVVTLEFNPKHAEVAQQNIANAGLSGLVDVRVGSALGTLAELVAQQSKPFDLIFIDADKPNIPQYFELSLKLSRPGSVIIVDNVVRNGAVIDMTNNDDTMVAIRRFAEMVKSDKRVDVTAMQTVGAKGYDGFALALVR